MKTTGLIYIAPRKEFRELAIGDFYWSFAADPREPLYLGGLIDFSSSGMGIRTHTRFTEGDILKICFERRWKNHKYGSVRWVREIEPNLYRSGLLLSDTIIS